MDEKDATRSGSKAGHRSGPGYTRSMDGNEATYWVNFHVGEAISPSTIAVVGQRGEEGRVRPRGRVRSEGRVLSEGRRRRGGDGGGARQRRRRRRGKRGERWRQRVASSAGFGWESGGHSGGRRGAVGEQRGYVVWRLRGELGALLLGSHSLLPAACHHHDAPAHATSHRPRRPSSAHVACRRLHRPRSLPPGDKPAPRVPHRGG